MHPETWSRAKEIFERLLRAPKGSRPALVEELCGENAELRELVMSLLRGASRTSGILDTPAADLSLFGDSDAGPGSVFSAGDELAGRFRIVRLIGSGGMGNVYEAEDLTLENARVAIKTIRGPLVSDSKIEARFRQEVYLARKVTHPNVCRIHEFFVHEPLGGAGSRECFFSMELAPGSSLRQSLRKRRFSQAEAIGILSQLASGLAAAHASGVIHGDFKAANILLVSEDSAPRAVITDFGLAIPARSARAESEIGSLAGGTPQYMAPELFHGEPATPASDVFSFGVVAVEVLTGALPAQTAEAAKIDLEPVKRTLRQAPSRIRDIIVRCLAESPDGRFGDAVALQHDWQNATGSASSRYGRRAWMFGVAGGAAGVVAARAFGLLGWRQRVPSLAVLPFHAMSAGLESLADGLADKVISVLSAAKNVLVIARSSSFQYKGAQTSDMMSFGRKLGADLLLTADVSLERGLYQVVTHLYQSVDGKQVWRQTISASAQSAFDLQQQIGMAVSRRLQIGLSPPVHKQPDPAAHEAYLTANYYWNKRDPESLKRALESFQEAIRIDADYPEAWAGLASTYQMLPNSLLPLPEATALAKEAARKALSLDDQLAAPHMVSALLSHRFDWDWQTAIREFQRAIDLEPQNARAHHWYAGTLSDLGYANDAIREIETAHQLDPLSFAVDTAAVMYLGAARRFEEAIDKGKRVIEVEPQYFRIYPFIALAYLGVHDLPHAMEAYERGYQLAPTDPYVQAHLAYACFRTGQNDRGTRLLDELMQRPVPPPPFYVAMVYCGRGDKVNALRWLERGFEERDPSMTMVKVHPALDLVRGEPEYRAILQKMRM